MVFSIGALTLYSTIADWRDPLIAAYGNIKSHLAWSQIEEEQAGEILVLVAQFRHLNTSDNEEARRIGTNIEVLFNSYANKLEKSVRVAAIPWEIQNSSNWKEAEKLAREKNATVVVWGDIAQDHNEIRYLNRLFSKMDLGWSTSETTVSDINENQRTFGSDFSGYAEFINNDLINAAAFLTHLVVADLLFFEQDAKSASQLYHKALGLAARDTHGVLGGNTAELISRMMTVRNMTMDAGINADLREYLELFTILVERTPTPRQILIKIDMELRLLEWTKADLEATLAQVNEMINDISISRDSATYIDAHFIKANILDGLAKPKEAKITLNSALEALEKIRFEPIDYGMETRKILAKIHLGLFKQADAHIQNMLRDLSDSRNTYWLRHFHRLSALSYEAQNLYEKSAQAGESAINYSSSPAHRAEILRGTAHAYSQAGNNIRSTELQEIIIQEGTASSWDFNNVGQAYLHAGRCRDALPLFEKALQIHEFWQSRMGLLTALVCSESHAAVAVERERVAADMQERASKIQGWNAALYVFYLFKLEAADAYFHGHRWPTRDYNETEVKELTAFAIKTFLAGRDTRFGIWMLTPIMQKHPENPVASSALGYLHSYNAREAFRQEKIQDAISALSKAYRCCTIDERVAEWLNNLPAGTQMNGLNPEAIRYANYEVNNSLP